MKIITHSSMWPRAENHVTGRTFEVISFATIRYSEAMKLLLKQAGEGQKSP
jgi:hypothetical protein